MTPQVTPFPEPSLGEPGRRLPQALAKDTEDARPQSEAPQWAPPGTQHPIKSPRRKQLVPAVAGPGLSGPGPPSGPEMTGLLVTEWPLLTGLADRNLSQK